MSFPILGSNLSLITFHSGKQLKFDHVSFWEAAYVWPCPILGSSLIKLVHVLFWEAAYVWPCPILGSNLSLTMFHSGKQVTFVLSHSGKQLKF